jgi:hypothetical protein
LGDLANGREFRFRGVRVVSLQSVFDDAGIHSFKSFLSPARNASTAGAVR